MSVKHHNVCSNIWKLALAGVILAGPASSAYANRPLLDLSREQSLKQIIPTPAGEVEFALEGDKPGVMVKVHPGKNEFPGVEVHPDTAVWNMSKFGYVEAKVTNTGTVPISICLRIDNDGDWTKDPWNAENAYSKAGETVIVRVRFGHSWGKPGFALDPTKVNAIHLFCNKSRDEQAFRIDSIIVGGSPGEKPPLNPQDVRTKPTDGMLLGVGKKLAVAPAVTAFNSNAELSTNDYSSNLKANFPAGSNDGYVILKPSIGCWDLSDYLEVVVHARNTGAAPVKIRAKLVSGSNESDWVQANTQMTPNGSQMVRLPFATSDVIKMRINGSVRGFNPFESDRASGIMIAADGEGKRSVLIDSVKAVVPGAMNMPSWLGKRPPVAGKWKQTMAEEFDGNNLNEKLWTIYHPNYWDKQAHFSKDNVILNNGMLTLRFDKKRGHENDDPSKPETDYATGFITSTHKWTQLYGYFESRIKLPHAPGMWPAFWMMPDRGEAAGVAREDTRDGGMEFDILEYLSRYGPYRYNIAMHWDGYEKDHKSVGTDRFYVQPDKDGFYTAGLLWEPGKLTFYCNGREIAQMTGDRVASVPEYILFTAVSGGWGGNDLTGQGFPSDLVIDYVRAWQKE